MKSNNLENAWLAHYFTNSDIANVGDATGLRGSVTAGSLHLSAHTAYPGEAGAQNTSECAYTGYARQGVVRSGSGFTVSTNQVVNAAQIQFGEKTGGSDETIFFVGVGRSAAGAGTLDYILPLASARGLFTAATDDNVSIPGVTFAVDDRICLFPFAEATFPTGITAGTVYFVRTVSGSIVTLSTTSGGSTVDITAAGAGIVFKMAGRLVNNGTNPTIAASGLLLNED
jgi:hypothetical protein